MPSHKIPLLAVGPVDTKAGRPDLHSPRASLDATATNLAESKRNSQVPTVGRHLIHAVCTQKTDAKQATS